MSLLGNTDLTFGFITIIIIIKVEEGPPYVILSISDEVLHMD